jgi:adenosylhomocysteine nucleosidase
VLVTAGACRERPAPPPTQQSFEVKRRPVAVLYTLDAEGEHLRSWATIRSDTVVAGCSIASGWMVLPLVLAATGIGMANAAATTQYVIDTFDPTAIIFTGLAGAVNPDYHVGDIIIPDRWITHDFGTWGKDGFRAAPAYVGRPDSAGFVRLRELPVDTALHRQLAWAAQAISFRFRDVGKRLPELHTGGVGVSGDGLVDSKSKRRQLRTDFKAEIVDRESAAVVQTAIANGVPVVVIRACSDLGRSSETASSELEESKAAAIYNASLVVRQFLEVEG